MRTSSVQRCNCVRRRQLALEQEIGGLEEAGLLGHLLDRIAAIAQDADVAVDVGDRAAARGGVQERGIVRQQTCPVRALDLAELGRVDRTIDDGQLVFGAGAVVDDGETFSTHDGLLWSRTRAPALTACASSGRAPAYPGAVVGATVGTRVPGRLSPHTTSQHKERDVGDGDPLRRRLSVPGTLAHARADFQSSYAILMLSGRPITACSIAAASPFEIAIDMFR